ncbi:MAG TPA: peroxidase, partial [Psychrobacter sp.]|nr:peroxidase [Psychrobacter sp.]
MNNDNPANESLLGKLKTHLQDGIEHGIEAIKDKFEHSDTPAEEGSVKERVHEAKQKISTQLHSVTTRATNAIYPNIATMELEDIQAIILHDRPAPYYGTLVALKVNDSNAGRELLKAVLPNVTGSKNFQKDMDANLTIVMTYEGLKALGLPQSSLDSFPENFKTGMAGRSDILGDKGDNDPSNWLA